MNTLGAEERRPFSDKTVKRLSRIGEEFWGRIPVNAVWRSVDESVGFSVD